MKKTIIIFMLALLPAFVYSQVRPYIGGARADSISFKLDNYTKWINGVSDDPTLVGNSHKKQTTEYAVKGYVDSQLSGLSISALEDSIQKHTDTLQAHNNRLKVLEVAKHTHSNSTILNNTTASFTTALSTAITNNTTAITQKQDSIDRHTDTLQWHNTRLKTMELIDHNHTNKTTILDNTTAIFTADKDTRLTDVRDTVLVMVRITTDTLTSSEVKSGYIFPIGRDIDEFNLTRVEAFSPESGNGTAVIKVYRLRGGVIRTVTAVGADINGIAIIDTDYDDVTQGDYYDFGYYETGATTYTVAVDVYLQFIRP